MFSCLRHGVKTYIRKLKGILMRRVWVFIFFYGFRECPSLRERFKSCFLHAINTINCMLGLDKLTTEEIVWSGWFVGEGDAQLIRGRCSTSRDRFWGNLSSLTDDGRWMVVLTGKWWQLNPYPKTLDHDCKIWLYDNKPLYDLEWDPLEVWRLTPGTKILKKFFEYNTKLGR